MKSMSDLPPLPKCKVGKRGRHHISAVLPGEDEGFLTFYCDLCMAVRRMPASGDIPVLDDMDADRIIEAARRASA